MKRIGFEHFKLNFYYKNTLKSENKKHDGGLRLSVEAAEAFMTWFKRILGRVDDDAVVIGVVVGVADVDVATGAVVVEVLGVVVVDAVTSDVIGFEEVGGLGSKSPFLSWLPRAASARTGRGFQIRRRGGWPTSGTRTKDLMISEANFL